MFERIAEMIRQALRPYDDQHAELISRIEELERRLNNIIRPGVILAVHPDGKLVQVKSGRNKTPWIKWLAPAAGVVREYRCPSVGEQVALLNYGGGDNSTQAWALCGVWSDKYLMPDDRPHVHTVDWGGGMRLEMDTEAGTLDWFVPLKTTFHTPVLHGTEQVSDFKRTMQADRGIYNGHIHGQLPPPAPQK